MSLSAAWISLRVAQRFSAAIGARVFVEEPGFSAAIGVRVFVEEPGFSPASGL
jgi:hypothetical protein